MWANGRGVMNPRTYVLSTEGMVKHAATLAGDTFIVATETGILHRLRKEIPGREFVAADDGAVCGYMKQITLEKVRDTLRDMAPTRRDRPRTIAARARVARSIGMLGRPRVDSRETVRLCLSIEIQEGITYAETLAMTRDGENARLRRVAAGRALLPLGVARPVPAACATDPADAWIYLAGARARDERASAWARWSARSPSATRRCWPRWPPHSTT